MPPTDPPSSSVANDPRALAALAETVQHSRRRELAFLVAREALRRDDDPADVVLGDPELQRVVRTALVRARAAHAAPENPDASK